MAMAPGHRSAWLFLLSLVLACCFSAEAAVARKKTHTNVRGAMNKEVNDKDDNDDDDDDDEEDDDDAPAEKKAPADKKQTKLVKKLNARAVQQARLQKELDVNVAEQAELEHKVKALADKSKSDQQIDASVKLVANETESPAMGHMLGSMWKDMRMFETPMYAEQVKEQIKGLKKEEKALQGKLAKNEKKTKEAAADSNEAANHGSEDCRCVGIDEIEGETTIALKKHGKVAYPADLGARCEAWDAETHPGCPGASWCKQEWCYVDPCKCKNVADLPKPSAYLPDAKYQGKPVHFSYATCGGKDSFSAEEEKKTAKDLEATCAIEVDAAKWGAENCRCVGVGPQPGTTKVAIKDKQVDFPADVGAFCNAWEEDNHPDCDGDEPPSWCAQKWCYVDPCSCKLPTPPKTSNYVPDANYQGKAVYYSYATCGGKDSWSKGRKDACVTQKSSGACGKLDKCAWTGNECLGKELVDVCNLEQPSKSAAWAPKAFSALILLILGHVY